MYLFGLSKEQVLSQKHVVLSKDTSGQNPISMVTLFGKQVYPVKTESSMSSDIDLRLPADHYSYSGMFYSELEANKTKEASANGKRNPKIVVINLEEPPTTEHDDSVSYVTIRSPGTKPSFSADRISDTEQCLLDLNSVPASELVSEPRYCFSQDLNCPYIEEAETSCEKSGIDDDGTTPLCSPKRHEKDGTASPPSYTSCCTTENNSRRTESRRSSSPRALDEPSCRTRLEFPAAENGCFNEDEEEKPSETVQMAAESLVHISAVLYQNQDFQSKSVSSLSQDQDFAGNAERGCSCDSYELHTLGISETNTEEEFCVSSMAREELNNVTRGNNKETGVKLRRGRRMKNFQKEILPSLTSLSRHEIREDINILEAVLRSKEYKKMQGKTKDVKCRANKRSVPQRRVGRRRRKAE